MYNLLLLGARCDGIRGILAIFNHDDVVVVYEFADAISKHTKKPTEENSVMV